MTKKIMFRGGLLLFAVALAIGCHNSKKTDQPLPPPGGLSEDQVWNRAATTNAIPDYEAYLSSFPAGSHVQEAKESLRELWDARVKTLKPEDMEKLTAVVETGEGVIKFKFFPRDAPNTVRNFIKLASSHFYDGLIFHRMIDGYLIQTGCPKGTGYGGPGYTIKAEFNGRPHLEGTVAMARTANPDSAGSQFYITLSPQPRLDSYYTVFGQVVEGLTVIHALAKTPVDIKANYKPLNPPVMKRVTIEGL